MSAPGERVLNFTVGGKPFALDAGAVSEVVRRPVVTRVPQGPPALAGLANVRGRVLPVVSLARLLDASARETRCGRLIVVDAPEPLALEVDAVSSLGAAADASARPLALAELLSGAFAGLLRRSSRPVRTGTAGVREQRSDSRQAVLRVEISGQAYGVPLDAVREVRNSPSEMLRVADADAAAAGAVEHRGALLPVVRPEVLLGLAGAHVRAASARTRIVVVRFGSAQLGLLVDAVDDILRIEAGRIAATPAILNRAAGEARIEAVARTERGLVALISPERLFQAQTVAALLGDRHEESAPMPAAAAASEQLLIFRLGEEAYALPIAAVDEVVRYPETVTRVPRAPAFLAGVANHRGEPLPIVDQRVRFAVPGAPPAAGRRVIVTRVDGVRVGFAVDAVEALRAVSPEELSETPDIAADGGQLFDRVADLELDGRLVLLVNPRELLAQAERDLIAGLATDPASR